MKRCMVMLMAMTLAGCSSEPDQQPADIPRLADSKPTGGKKSVSAIKETRVAPEPANRTAAPGVSLTQASVPTPIATAVPTTGPASGAATPAMAAAETQSKPTPVSQSRAANYLAAQGLTPPPNNAPQVVMAEPKELQLSEGGELLLQGFNLKGCKVTVTPSSGEGDAVSLNSDSPSGEQLTIVASEWKKLKPGSYLLTVTNNRGESAALSFPMVVE